MKLKSQLVLIITLTLILAGCTNSVNKTSDKEKTAIPKTVTRTVNFRASAHLSNPSDASSASPPSPTPAPASPLPGVSIIVIGTDGEVIDQLVTNEQGEAEKALTVPVDLRYYADTPGALEPRGTVTAIAFKEGYRPKVLFEVPVDTTAQPFTLEPMISGERNEPDVQLGNNHHLEILTMVEKYQALLTNSD